MIKTPKHFIRIDNAKVRQLKALYDDGVISNEYIIFVICISAIAATSWKLLGKKKS